MNQRDFTFISFKLRKAVVDHVSDTFLETNVPLLVLIEAAKAGDERGVEEYAQVFMEHANKLVEVIIYVRWPEDNVLSFRASSIKKSIF